MTTYRRVDLDIPPPWSKRSVTDYSTLPPVIRVMRAINNGKVALPHETFRLTYGIEAALAQICAPFAHPETRCHLSVEHWLDTFRPRPWSALPEILPSEVRTLSEDAATMLLMMHLTHQGPVDNSTPAIQVAP